MARDGMDLPEHIRSAVEQLWKFSFKNEVEAFTSAHFRMLGQVCASTYSEVPGSRLPKKPTGDENRRQLRKALERFFRWNGAPWYKGTTPDAADTAWRLHRAFLMPEVRRTYFVPLDRLELADRNKRPPKTIQQIGFGPCEIALLEKAALLDRIPVAALGRFDRGFWFPVDDLAGFYWLIVAKDEEAGPIWRRSWYAIFDTPLDAIGRLTLYEPTYPAPLEDALFVLLLCLVKEPSDVPWEPFYIPWIYSLTNDQFAEPPPAPDPSRLSWTLVGPPNEEFEVPDRSERFKVTQEELEAALTQRWRLLQSALERLGTDRASLNPLTRHFFVKAFSEHGIDQVLANLSCIEATLMLPREKRRTEMMKRYERLVRDGNAYAWLDDAYDIRNKYLHSTGHPGEAMSWEDFANTRWSIVKGVDAYLSLTATRADLNREQLLSSLT